MTVPTVGASGFFQCHALFPSASISGSISALLASGNNIVLLRWSPLFGSATAFSLMACFPRMLRFSLYNWLGLSDCVPVRKKTLKDIRSTKKSCSRWRFIMLDSHNLPAIFERTKSPAFHLKAPHSRERHWYCFQSASGFCLSLGLDLRLGSVCVSLLEPVYLLATEPAPVFESRRVLGSRLGDGSRLSCGSSRMMPTHQLG